jgi:hypothetical protein
MTAKGMNPGFRGYKLSVTVFIIYFIYSLAYSGNHLYLSFSLYYVSSLHDKGQRRTLQPLGGATRVGNRNWSAEMNIHKILVKINFLFQYSLCSENTEGGGRNG